MVQMSASSHIWCLLLTLHSINGQLLPVSVPESPIPEVPEISAANSELELELEHPQGLTSAELDRPLPLQSPFLTHKMFNKEERGCANLANRNGTLCVEPTSSCASVPEYSALPFFGAGQPYVWVGCRITFEGAPSLDGVPCPAGLECETREKGNPTKRILTVWCIQVQEDDDENTEKVIKEIKNIEKSDTEISDMRAGDATDWITGRMQCDKSCPYTAKKHGDNSGSDTTKVIMCDPKKPAAVMSQRQLDVLKNSLRDEKDSIPERKPAQVQKRPEGVKIQCYENPIKVPFLNLFELVKDKIL